MNAFSLFSDRLPGSDRYEVEAEVGHGTYSEVHRARHRAGGDLVALKHMYLQPEDVLPLHIQREIDALRALRHPNVVALRETCQQAGGICLVLQHCVADLREVLQRAGGRPLAAAVVKSIAQQLLRALQACHAACLMHRDVSTTNILFDEEGCVRLADFGLARRPAAVAAAEAGTAEQEAAAKAGGAAEPISGGESSTANGHPGPATSSCVTPGVGTRWYTAPEVLFGSRRYGTAVDLWAAGCVLAELLTGRPLFAGTSDIDQICRMMALLGSITEARWPSVKELPDWGKLAFPHKEAQPWERVAPGATPAALDLLGRLLSYDPRARPSAAEALHAEYFAEGPAPADNATVAAAVRALLSQPKAARCGVPASDEEAALL